MAAAERHTSFGNLPSEILILILRGTLSTLNTVCLVSKRLRSVAEPLLYRYAGIISARALRIFRASVEQDRFKASCVRVILILFPRRYQNKEEYVEVEWTLAMLPNLTHIVVDSPYQIGSGLGQMATGFLDPLSSTAIFGNLTSCFLNFSVSSFNFWSPDESLCLLYLPSLRELAVERLQCEDFPPNGCPVSSVGLPPLSFLVFRNCDIAEVALEKILAVRQTRALSCYHSDDGPPSVEFKNGNKNPSTYMQLLARSTASTLELLTLDRLWDADGITEIDEMVNLAAFESLRSLRTTPLLLFGRKNRTSTELVSLLEQRLPPKLNFLFLRWEEETEPKGRSRLDYALTTLLGVKAKGVVPHMSRIHIICDSGRSLDEMRLEDSIHKKFIEAGCLIKVVSYDRIDELMLKGWVPRIR